MHDRNPRQGDGTDHGVILGGFRLFITTESRSIVIPGDMDGGGPATPYPAVEPISGQNGVIEDVFVYLHNISHNRPDDLDVLLVAPGGQKVVLISDACGGIPIPNGTTLRFNHDDPPVPDHGICNTGPGGSGVNYSPTNHAPEDSFPAPAPPGPYTTLAALRGTSPTAPGGCTSTTTSPTALATSRTSRCPSTWGRPSPIPSRRTPSSAVARTRARVPGRRRSCSAPASRRPPSSAGSTRDRGRPAPRRGRTGSWTVGQHQVRVRATDVSGNRDASPATWQWRIRR